MGRIGLKVTVLLWASLVFSSPAMAEVDVFASDLRIGDRAKDFGVVSLTCPASADSQLVLISGKRTGEVINRYSLEYQDETAIAVFSENSQSGGPYKKAIGLDLRNLSDPELLPAALELMERGNALLNEVCNGSPEAKQRYRELLDSNLSILGLSPEDYPSDF